MELRSLFALGRPAPVAPIDPTARFLARITADLARGPLNLPCFPDIVPRVRKALDDPEATADDIVKVAGAEPRLAARLLQTANSAALNPNGKAVPHLRAAVARLGADLVQSVTMAFAVQQLKADPTLRPYAAPLTALWKKSIAVASICQVLAQQLKVPADRVFLMGLLHGIGHFYILVRAAEAGSDTPYGNLSQEQVARSHPAIGVAVLEKWGFEAQLCESVGRQLDYGRQSRRAADVVDVLVGSVLLAEAMLDHDGDLSRTEGVTAFGRLQLMPAQLRAVLLHTEHSIGALDDALAR